MARNFNMPKDRIENAIKKASSKESEGLDEITYEAYAPHGVALYIESATNNTTRTVTGSLTVSPGPTTLGSVANTIKGFFTGVVFSTEP